MEMIYSMKITTDFNTVVKIRPFRYGNDYYNEAYNKGYEELKSDRFGMEITTSISFLTNRTSC